MRRLLALLALSVLCAASSPAADMNVPQQVTANSPASISTSGSGEATFYLFGPVGTIKQKVQLGQAIQLPPEDLRAAGQYAAVLREGSNSVGKTFWVVSGPAAKLNFISRPSRVPVATQNAISGVAVVWDAYRNLDLGQPAKVHFDLSVAGTQAFSKDIPVERGIAWARIESAKKSGEAQFVAALPDQDVHRVIQQVPSDPCSIRMKAQPSPKGILVETDPIRDCTGNPVPDGTIVTFIMTDANGRSTVDARIKKDVAQAILPPSNNATISVASGVVIGNEIAWKGSK